jgi:hypothetical protein
MGETGCGIRRGLGREGFKCGEKVERPGCEKNVLVKLRNSQKVRGES